MLLTNTVNEADIFIIN